jgi:hypothetical protein
MESSVFSVSASAISILSVRPRIAAESFTFRPKGDAGEERRTSMSKPLSIE